MSLLRWLTRDVDIHAATHAPYRLLEEAPKPSHGNRDSATAFLTSEITVSPPFPFFLPYRRKMTHNTHGRAREPSRLGQFRESPLYAIQDYTRAQIRHHAVMIRSSPKPLSMCEIQRLANRADRDGDLTAVWAGAPRGQAAPNGLAEIMRRSGQSSLGVSGGLTLIKNAAAFTAPSFRTTTNHRRQAGRVEHFAVVQQTTAADVTHESFYPMAGDHLRPGMSQRIGGRTYNHYWRISAQVANLIREGEQEHLNDACRAYELTYKLIADEINALSGQQFGPANTPAAATGLAENALSARLPRQLGTNPANWVRVLDRLLLQTQSRDRDGWHALDIGPPQTIGNKIIHPVTQRRTTRIGRVTSRQVVNY